MERFVDADRPAARQRHVRHAAPALSVDRTAGDLALAHRRDERADVVDEEEELVAAVLLGGMHGDLGGRQAEDEPTAADVDLRQTEDITKERTVRVWIGAVHDRVRARDHRALLLVRLDIRLERIRDAVVQVRDRGVHDEFDQLTLVEESAEALVRRLREARRLRELGRTGDDGLRSEEHTSELQSPYDLVCRLLLEKK